MLEPIRCRGTNTGQSTLSLLCLILPCLPRGCWQAYLRYLVFSPSSSDLTSHDPTLLVPCLLRTSIIRPLSPRQGELPVLQHHVLSSFPLAVFTLRPRLQRPTVLSPHSQLHVHACLIDEILPPERYQSPIASSHAPSEKAHLI